MCLLCSWWFGVVGQAREDRVLDFGGRRFPSFEVARVKQGRIILISRPVSFPRGGEELTSAHVWCRIIINLLFYLFTLHSTIVFNHWWLWVIVTCSFLTFFARGLNTSTPQTPLIDTIKITVIFYLFIYIIVRLKASIHNLLRYSECGIKKHFEMFANSSPEKNNRGAWVLCVVHYPQDWCKIYKTAICMCSLLFLNSFFLFRVVSD